MRKLAGLLSIVAALMLLAAPVAQAAAKYKSPKPILSIGSHGSGSMYVVFLAAWSKVLTDNFDGVSVNVEAGSPTKNIVFVTNKETDFGMTSDLHSALGMKGEDWSNGTKYTDIRSLIPCYATNLVAWSLEKNKVKKFPQDLHGAIIAPGPKGAGTDIFLTYLLKAFPEIKPAKIVYSTWTDTSSLLADGLADVAINTGGHPAGFIQELETRHPLNIMTFNAADQERFMKVAGDYYTTATLDPVYKSMNGKPFTNDVGSCNFIFTHKDMPADFVYNVLKATWDNADQIRAANPGLFAWMQMEHITNVPVPLHPGAVKFYQEHGVKIPARLMPK